MRTAWLKIIIFTAIIMLSGMGYVSFARKYFVIPDSISQTKALLTDGDSCSPAPCPDGPHKSFSSGSRCKILFSPDDNIRKTLLALIDSEQEQILIAIFSLTDQKIVKSLIAAHKRGVRIELVADRSNAANQWNKVHTLARAGIPVHLYPQETSGQCPEKGQEKCVGACTHTVYSIMHHKFAVFTKTIDDRRLVFTGSYNFTNSASESNQENVVIIQEPAVAERYADHFQLLKKRATLTHADHIKPRRRSLVRNR